MAHTSKKKQAVTGMVLLFILVIMLSACGKVQEEENVQSTVEPTEKVAVTDDVKTRLVKHAKGETEIPTNPQRIVTSHYLGDFLALGLKPVGTQGFLTEDYYLKDEAQGVADIGSPVDRERVLALAPDLIVLHDAQDYELFKDIAPTVVVPWDDYNQEEQLLQIGMILNKEDEARAWLAAFAEEVADAKKALADRLEKGETVAFIWLSNKYIQVYAEQTVLYSLLGLKQPQQIIKDIAQNPDQFKVLVSLEKLPQYDADHIFLIASNDETTKELSQGIKSSSLWKGLGAVKNNQVYEVEETAWISSDPISLLGQLREAVEKLSH